MSQPIVKPLRILEISANSPPQICGIGDYTHYLSQALKSRGIEVKTWSGANADYNSPGWTPLAVWRTFHQIKFDQFDVIHLQYEPFGFQQSYLLPFLLARCGTRLIVTFHEIFQRHKLQVIRDAYLARSATDLIVNDAGSEIKLRTLVRSDEAIIHRIGVGSNIPDSTPLHSQDGEIFRLGYFGFLNAVKRVDLLIEALSVLHRKGETKIRLRLIGDFQASAGEKSSLESLARQLNVESAIEWCVGLSGDDVAKKISECDLMVLPFVDGATPRRGSFQACLKLGRAVATTLPAAEDSELQLVTNVLVIEKLDVETVVETVLKAVANPALVKRLEVVSRSLAEKFSWTSIAASHHKIYNSTIL